MLLNQSNRSNERLPKARPNQQVVCTWCGTVIRSNAEENEEQMCLICHARMLNDYFQRVRRVSDERRAASRRF
jgi:hypothetical protein